MMVNMNPPLTTHHSPLKFSLGLIGYPLGHSLSPQIHGAALRTLNLSGEYKLYPVDPTIQGRSKLAELLNVVRAEEIHGLNVTIPHKQNVIPLLDELTPAAKAIGAVNTIFKRDDTLVGDNTDAPGFWADLQRLAVSGQQAFATGDKPSAIILGAGGSARAVAYALLTHGWRVTIAARRMEQAEELCVQFSVFSRQLSVVRFENAQLTTRYSLLVNTTPVGMQPHEDESPWPGNLPFPGNAAIYDLVYNPRATLLVKRAREAGLPAVTGLGMLIEQAALAFERWTGLEAPREAMQKAVC